MSRRSKVLITGASGFSARFLRELLAKDPAIELHLLSRRALPDARSYVCDLEDGAGVQKVIGAIAPDFIYHCAGSFTNDYTTDHRSNVITAKNVLDSVATNPTAKVLLIGSAAEYGDVREADNPVSEEQALRPVSVYGLTKVHQTHVMDYYRRVHNLPCVMARPFNLLGPGASARLFIGRIYREIEKYKKGEIGRITVGNLTSARDYIRVEDAVRHYRTIMERGIAGEVYNVGSGAPIVLSELLRQIMDEAGLDMSIVESVERREAGKKDVPVVYADIRKLQSLYQSS